MTGKTLRRTRHEMMTPAEQAIQNASLEIEKLPPDERLTQAHRLLHEAQSKVADFVDGGLERVGFRAAHT